MKSHSPIQAPSGGKRNEVIVLIQKGLFDDLNFITRWVPTAFLRARFRYMALGCAVLKLKLAKKIYHLK